MSRPSSIPPYASMDQCTLDREYSPSSRLSVPIDGYLRNYAARSREARGKLRGSLNLSYGSHPDESLDLFTPARQGAPLVIFFHGGYWQVLGKEDFSYLAPPFVARGVAYASINYTLMPRADIDGIVDQSRRAIAWITAHALELGVDPARVFLSGHSAGAQLAALCLHSFPSVQGACLVSGIFDLEPLRRASENAAFRFTPESVARNSPIHHLPRPGQSILACYGEMETSEFKRQTHQYVDACTALGVEARAMALPGFNHFDVVSELAEATSPLFQAAIAQIERSP